MIDPKHNRITASPGDRDVDEIVATGIDIHVERVSDGQVWFALYRDDVPDALHFWLTAERKGELAVSAYWDGVPWPDMRHEIRRDTLDRWLQP